MIVEFIGMPGSGKSAICRRVEQLVRAKGYFVRSPVEQVTRSFPLFRKTAKMAAVLVFAIRRPIVFWTLSSRLLKLKSSAASGSGAALFNFLFVAALTSAGKFFDGVMLIDQGLMQGMASLAYSAGTGSELSTLCKDTEDAGLVSDLTVFVDASDEELVRRLSSRRVRESRVEDDLEFGIKRFRDSIASVEGLIADVEARSGGTRLRIVNETEANLEESVRLIAQCIEEEVN